MSSGTEGPSSAPRPGQLAFNLGDPKPRYSRESFVVSDSNRGALAVVDGFMSSSEAALAICGPASSGKSHLAHVLASQNAATVHQGLKLDAVFADNRFLAVIDDADADACADPKRLVALLEERRSRGLKTALAGRGRPSEWAGRLRDLVTRLEAMPRASLSEPDEGLMRAVIEQQFRDRQWRVARGVAAYAAPRLPRTFAAANAFVAAIGEAAVKEGKAINLAHARAVLGRLSEGFPCE